MSKELERLVEICHSNIRSSKDCLKYLVKERGLSKKSRINNKLGFFPQKIDILINGRAEGHPRLKNLVDNNLVSQLRKDQFYKKHSESRTQGIIIEFSGKIIEDKLPDF